MSTGNSPLFATAYLTLALMHLKNALTCGFPLLCSYKNVIKLSISEHFSGQPEYGLLVHHHSKLE